jgi:hypothetical protein
MVYVSGCKRLSGNENEPVQMIGLEKEQEMTAKRDQIEESVIKRVQLLGTERKLVTSR